MTTRPESFVTFPGDAGVFHQREDRNKADADTAHVVQSPGLWTEPRFNFTADADPTPDPSAPFGESSYGGVTNGVSTANTYLRVGFNTSAFPVSPGEEWSASLAINPDAVAATRGFRLVLWWLDSGGGFLSQDNGPTTTLTPDSWDQRLAHTATAPASAAYLAPGWEMVAGADMPDGARVMLSAFLLAEGSDPTFVPSLRVASLDIESDLALPDWTPTADYRNIASQWISGATNWYLAVRSSGVLALSLAGTGVYDSTVPTGLADGTRAVVRAVYDDSQIASFYVNGSPLGASQGPGAPMQQNGVFLEIASRDSGAEGNLEGALYRVTMRDGEDGPAVAEWLPDEILGGGVP